MVPVGALSGVYAREISRQNELAAAVGLMVSWRLPDPETARTLSSAWPDYERTEDLAALEHAVTAGWARRTAGALKGAGPAGEPLRRFFTWETDERNLLVALRPREALARGETGALPVLSGLGPYLPGGTIKPGRFDDGIRLPDAERVAASLADAGPEAWRAPLEGWSRTGDLVALQADLEARRVRDAVALFLRGDPLGLDVPVAYAAAKENEARNLRLIAEGAVRGLAPERVRARLVFPETRSETA